MAFVLRRVYPRAVPIPGALSSFCWRIKSCDDERLALLSTAVPSHKPRGEKEETRSYKLGLLLGLGCFYLYSYTKNKEDMRKGIFQTAGCTATESDDKGAGQRRSARYNFLADTVEKVSPSVVGIEQRMFQHRRAWKVQAPIGSGFIINGGRYVLTNAHVVHSTQSVTVKLYNGRTLTGTVTHTDHVADLALIKLDLPKGSEPLPSLEFGSSASLRPGEWVIALGSPLSLSNTITSGVVSSVHRPASEIPDQRLQYQKPDMEYVQTDAAILPGNSGGPLVNLDGEVIGVNVMTAGPGISFAIPSDFAKRFLERASKKTSRSSGSASSHYGIGISMLTISPVVLPHIQNRFTSFAVSHGVLLVDVWRGSPADAAGLRKNDIIIEMNSKEVRNSEEIYQEVQKGKTVEFLILRGHEKKIIRVNPEPF
ncbi:PREDICTED: serine protease HTRA2, mitochondrial-like [Amphimedon queenslandica]|uniref:PDZ domain-containing protein n=1 Tax=Amphimedon queenslandica TaxID=400682 RepID=A0A1X7UJG3_AMPQE|nr:PREDICTED: serine protease HTRA2, mitochondrial-like [Amphimedon queenslandica]|eukprot:XP_019853750.1 PREDICTED: serine protease HTRA2, mitochondrial-like [Amphimedon queenslandica]